MYLLGRNFISREARVRADFLRNQDSFFFLGRQADDLFLFRGCCKILCPGPSILNRACVTDTRDGRITTRPPVLIAATLDNACDPTRHIAAHFIRVLKVALCCAKKKHLFLYIFFLRRPRQTAKRGSVAQ